MVHVGHKRNMAKILAFMNSLDAFSCPMQRETKGNRFFCTLFILLRKYNILSHSSCHLHLPLYLEARRSFYIVSSVLLNQNTSLPLLCNTLISFYHNLFHVVKCI